MFAHTVSVRNQSSFHPRHSEMQATDVLQVSVKAWGTPRGCCVFNNLGRGNVRSQQ